ncbi:MAG: sulfotransferase, partial [Rickettsiales bacterium]|nr:sulfotransferase [Rickettsiales bacterium]
LEAPFHAKCAELCRTMGNLDAAYEAYATASQLAPKNAHYPFHQGTILYSQRKFEPSIPCFIEASSRNPRFAEALQQLVMVYEHLNRLEEAAAVMETLETIAPNAAYTLYLKGLLARRRGDLATAKTTLEHSIQRASTAEADLLALLHTELGKICESQKDYDTAFLHYCDAQKQARAISASHTTTPNMFDRLLKISEDWGKHTHPEHWAMPDITNDAPPLFLMGFPRSGTSLTDQILAAHPALETIEEKELILNLIPELGNITGQRNVQYPEILDTLTLEQVTTARAKYCERLKAEAPHANGLLIDKLPLNVIHLGFIARLFPDAKIIMLLRDPRDVCLSCFTQFFEHNDAMQHFYRLDSSIALYARVMQCYLRFRETLPLAIHEVRYEDIVQNTEATCRTMLDFIGAPWDDAVLQYHTRRRDVLTPSYEAVTQPIYTRSLGRWKHFASSFVPYQQTLAPFIQAFGYA